MKQYISMVFLLSITYISADRLVYAFGKEPMISIIKTSTQISGNMQEHVISKIESDVVSGEVIQNQETVSSQSSIDSYWHDMMEESLYTDKPACKTIHLNIKTKPSLYVMLRYNLEKIISLCAMKIFMLRHAVAKRVNRVRRVLRRCARDYLY